LEFFSNAVDKLAVSHISALRYTLYVSARFRIAGEVRENFRVQAVKVDMSDML